MGSGVSSVIATAPVKSEPVETKDLEDLFKERVKIEIQGDDENEEDDVDLPTSQCESAEDTADTDIESEPEVTKPPPRKVIKKDGKEGELGAGAAAAAPAPKLPPKDKYGRKVLVCYSRRTDGVRNKAMLKHFFESMARGVIEYDFPRTSLNKVTTSCIRSLDPSDVAIIGWWSKDYANLINDWDAKAELLKRYKHHFSFTFNGEANSILEPGLVTTCKERLVQLEWLVNKCKELGQDPDASIMVHVDPIVVYRVEGSDKKYDNLGHLPALGAKMRELGLTRIHISFLQLDWRKVKTRLKRLEPALKIAEISTGERVRLLEKKVFPHTNGIQLQTCTASDVLTHYGTDDGDGDGDEDEDGNLPLLVRGACVGSEDVAKLTTDKVLNVKRPTTSGATVRVCHCHAFVDVGSQRSPCDHGCIYCFMHPRTDADDDKDV